MTPRLASVWGTLLTTSLCTGLLAPDRARGADLAPANSVVRALGAGEQLHLVSVLDAGSAVRPGGWHLQETGVEPADRALGVKLGREALKLHGVAQDSGKGDFAVEGSTPADVKAIGCWMYVGESSNVGQVGLQFYDAEGEALSFLQPVDWTGWKWIETPVTSEALKQAYPQKEKNGRPDQPLKSVNVIWFSKTSGRSELVVDALIARATASEEARRRGVSVSIEGASDALRDQKYGGSLLVTNASDKPAKVQIQLSLQRDGRNDHRPLPDPVRGTDLALSSRSWAVVDGERVDDHSLTDGLDYTAFETPYRSKYWQSAEQVIELPAATEVTALGWLAGDANWVAKVDVSASSDGVKFTPVPELQGVDLKSKWGRQEFPAFKPFQAKQIKLHYHNDGEKTDVIRMPSAISIWNGVADEQLDLPQIGEEIQRLTFDREANAGAFDVIDYEFEKALPTGQYVIASRVQVGETITLGAKPVYVEPARLENVTAESRFGLNASTPSLAKELRKLGVGWVRFENFKWPMVSPKPHEFNFTGGTAPWHLNIDDITREYRDAGLNILPMMFLTPEWASSPGEKVTQGMKLSQPPHHDADFGEFAFQAVARYGQTHVDPSLLKTPDHLSGLNRIHYYELGNEPDLNPLRDPERPPSWGAWAGTMDQWWAMWLHGAQAVKAADPQAQLASPGFAGATVETVDALRRHKTPEGKPFLDLVDVVSVHFYSGRTPPEIAKGDVNNSQGYEVTFIEHLKRLDEWRDKHKPTAKLWMTETGYDAGGPIGTNEWFQAARLPRVVALCLANGIDKVIVYRESGSDASMHAGAGVVRNDHSRRPSWYTYATLIRQLENAQPAEHLPVGNRNIWLQRWQRNGETLLMVNAVTGEEQLGIELGPTTVVDAFGGETRVESTHDLKLTEYPLYLSKITDEAPLQPLIAASKLLDEFRTATRRVDADRHVFLYAFGAGTEPIGVDFGGLRYFTQVNANDVYTAKTKPGFVGGPAKRNDFRHWMPTPAERHAVEMDKDQVCRFDGLTPGVYEVRISGVALGGPATLTLDGAERADGNGDAASVTFSGGDEVLVRNVQLTDDSLQLKCGGRCLLRWLTLKQLVGREAREGR